MGGDAERCWVLSSLCPAAGGTRGTALRLHPPVQAPSAAGEHSPCLPAVLTLKPTSPFLQHRQANMRKMKVKSPEKETATTASEEDQESSLRGVLSAGGEGAGEKLGGWAQSRVPCAWVRAWIYRMTGWNNSPRLQG